MKVVDLINHYSQFPGDMDINDVPKPVEPRKEEVAREDHHFKKH